MEERFLLAGLLVGWDYEPTRSLFRFSGGVPSSEGVAGFLPVRDMCCLTPAGKRRPKFSFLSFDGGDGVLLFPFGIRFPITPPRGEGPWREGLLVLEFL